MAKPVKSPGRITREDLASAMSNPNLTEDEQRPDYYTAEEDRQVVIYTIFGKHHSLEGEDKLPVLYDIRYDDDQVEYAEDSMDACAKMVMSGNVVTYFVKVGYGGHFYNPIGLYAEAAPRRKQGLGRDEWNFIKIHRAAFDMYLRFLATKNKRYLISAEREVR